MRMHTSPWKPVAMGILLLFATFTAACAGAATPEPITDIEWQWEAVEETAPQVGPIVPHPEKYTLTLNSDGTVDIRADCNLVGGTYELQANDLSIVLGPSTLAYCGDGSLDQDFLALLELVGHFNLVNGQLELGLRDDAGTMYFSMKE
jgi:heat shock protein HslJ